MITLGLNDLPYLASKTTDWARRVVANGGAAPSASTISAMETFRLGLVSAGLDTKIHSLCVFVPDSLTAALTPLIKNKGSDPWTNHSFVSGDLTVEGIKGDAASKYLDTGVQAKSGQAVDSGTGNCGLTLIVTESNSNAVGYEIGHQNNNLGVASLKLQVSSAATAKTGFLATDSAGSSAAFNTDFGRAGYVSGNSVGGVLSVFTASPQESHVQFSTASIATTATTTSETIFGFCINEGGSPTGYSGERISVMAIHTGFSISESATFWGLLKTLRDSLGGGSGSRITDWAAKIVRLGGAAPSSNTKSALDTFYQALNTAGIATKMVAVNCLVPDSLDASRTPIIWRAGNEQWTNHNFISGDLTTSGLAGNGTNKYLDTGIVPSAAVILTDTSVGLSEMLSVVASENKVDVGVARDASKVLNLLNQSGTAYFQAWKNTTAGTDYVTGALPSSTWAGFISGNRTASNAIALYRASTANSFASIASGSGSSTGVRVDTYSLVEFAYNVNTGGIQSYTGHTHSFMSLHAGLTSTESQALYNAVAAMRTSLGGGNP